MHNDSSDTLKTFFDSRIYTTDTLGGLSEVQWKNNVFQFNENFFEQLLEKVRYFLEGGA